MPATVSFSDLGREWEKWKLLAFLPVYSQCSKNIHTPLTKHLYISPSFRPSILPSIHSNNAAGVSTLSGLELDVEVSTEQFVLTNLEDVSVLSHHPVWCHKGMSFFSPFFIKQNAECWTFLMQIFKTVANRVWQLFGFCLSCPTGGRKVLNLDFSFSHTHTQRERLLGCCLCGHKVVRSPPTAWVCQVYRQACYQGHLMDQLFTHTHTHRHKLVRQALSQRCTQPQSLEHNFGLWARTQVLQINFAFFIQTDCVKSYFPLWKVPPNPLDLIPPQRES